MAAVRVAVLCLLALCAVAAARPARDGATDILKAQLNGARRLKVSADAWRRGDVGALLSHAFCLERAVVVLRARLLVGASHLASLRRPRHARSKERRAPSSSTPTCCTAALAVGNGSAATRLSAPECDRRSRRRCLSPGSRPGWRCCCVSAPACPVASSVLTVSCACPSSPRIPALPKVARAKRTKALAVSALKKKLPSRRPHNLFGSCNHLECLFLAG